MIKFRQMHCGSDCTGPYLVEISSPMTVKQFVEELLTKYPGEWGYIGVKNGDRLERIEYRHGKLISDPFSDNLLDKEIDSITGSGGWSRSDFTLTVTDPPIPKEVLDKAFPPIDYDKKPPFDKKVFDECVYEPANYIQSYIDNCMDKLITCEETEYEFIFDHFTKYVNEELFTPEYQTVIPKRLLERALICFKEEHREEWDVLVGDDSKEYFGCIYCKKVIDNSGLEGYICRNKTVETSWCRPMCGRPYDCSICGQRVTKEMVKNESRE